jgi:hypothetical protein
MNRMSTALLWVGSVFALLFLGALVWGNDAGSRTEVSMLNGERVVARATALECDALYHAIWKVKQEPSHSTLVSIANQLDCPFPE